MYFYQTDNPSLQNHFANGFFQVGYVAPVKLTGFIPVCGIRIGWILKCRRIYGAIFLGSQTTFIIFNNRLVRKASDKKLVFRHFLEICFSQFQQAVTVCQQGLNNCLHVIISLLNARSRHLNAPSLSFCSCL